MKLTAFAIAAACAVAALSIPANANPGEYGYVEYDRYGYHPPRYGRWYDPGFIPVDTFSFRERYDAPPRRRYYDGPTYICHFDNGFDLRAHRICRRVP
jgi:hypothetical protein